MFKVVFLDELFDKSSSQFKELSRQFEENCILFDYRDDNFLIGLNNISSFFYDGLEGVAPYWNTNLDRKTFPVCIFRCDAFFDDRLLAIINDNYFTSKSKVNSLFSFDDYVGVRYIQYSTTFYIKEQKKERKATVEELNIMTSFLPTLYRDNYVTFKERNDLDRSIIL